MRYRPVTVRQLVYSDMAAQHTCAKIISVKEISEQVKLFTLLSPDIATVARPGQFIHVKVPGVILRRPLSIHDVDGDKLKLLFRVRGKGTSLLAKFKKGDELDILGPLGNGFTIDKAKIKNSVNVLVAGGIGVAPLMFLARVLAKMSKTAPLVLIGARHKQDILAVADFKKLGCKVMVATDDGSQGIKGNTIDLLRSVIDDKNKFNLFACGPEVMFKALHSAISGKHNVYGQVSFEQFMGCGVGTCCGCTVHTKHGYKKACKDGPVFDINDAF